MTHREYWYNVYRTFSSYLQRYSQDKILISIDLDNYDIADYLYKGNINTKFEEANLETMGDVLTFDQWCMAKLIEGPKNSNIKYYMPKTLLV